MGESAVEGDPLLESTVQEGKTNNTKLCSFAVNDIVNKGATIYNNSNVRWAQFKNVYLLVKYYFNFYELQTTSTLLQNNPF